MIATPALFRCRLSICACYHQIYDDATSAATAAAAAVAAEHAGKDVFLAARHKPRADTDPVVASISNEMADSISAALRTQPADAGGAIVSSQPSHQRSHKISRAQARQRHVAEKVSRLAGTSIQTILDSLPKVLT